MAGFGDFWDFRVRHTEKSYNYKLRATWITPDVIRASARFYQLKHRLTDRSNKAIVAEFTTADKIPSFYVESIRGEGSGVVPTEWQSLAAS